MTVTYKLHTVCMVRDGDRVLLINRTHDPVIRGYIAPGGKIEFPESPLEGAIREVQEETGLTVKDLQYKGLHEFVNERKGERYMIFNYLATRFEGELRQESPEGRAEWVPISELQNLPMLPSVRRRLPLFFEPGVFEIHTRWDEGEQDETVRRV